VSVEDRTPRVLASAPSEGRAISTASVIGALLVLLVGIAIGAILAGGGEETALLPSVDDSGVPSGFAHSEDGAAQAAAAYTDLFTVDLAFDQKRARAVLERIGTPAFVEQQVNGIVKASRPIVEAAERFGGIAATGGSSAVEVERYDDETASVRVVMVVAAGVRRAPGQVGVDEWRLELRWEDDQWRAASATPNRDIVELEMSAAGSNAMRAALEGTEVAR
jgi:hypothetical protein